MPTIENLKFKITDRKNKWVEVVGVKKTNVETVIIPSSITTGGKEYKVTSIGKSAFARCFSLTSITIPASVSSIGKFAFEFTMLEESTIPAAVATVGEGAFSNTYLMSLTIEDGTTELALGGDEDETGVFSGTSIMNLSLSKRVKSIGAYAFQFVRGFETLELPEDSIL